MLHNFFMINVFYNLLKLFTKNVKTLPVLFKIFLAKF